MVAPVRFARNDAPSALRYFDGVICFGDSDWWYHNHGHYDMQMMRQLSQHVPVLYVNSIGVRVPSVREGGMFLHRMVRKIRSLARGLVRVQDNFTVFSPLVIPGRFGLSCSKEWLALQVRWAARRCGIHQSLVWVACPAAAPVVPSLYPSGVVYQRTDAYENFPGVDADLLRRLDLRMKGSADLTLFCSSYLLDNEQRQCRRALFLDHGVDFERYAAAGTRSETGSPGTASGGSEASLRISRLPHPRVGFVGSIDSHTFDPSLFGEVVAMLPDVQFVLVGGCSLPEGWCAAPNVTMLGQQPYESVAECMAACDVLIMPWRNNEWIRACNPVKLKEYLAVGKPVVSTPFEELRRYDGLVRVASTGAGFASHIRAALASPPAPQVLRQRVAKETWAAKERAVLEALASD